MPGKVRHPGVHVELVGQDGNAFSILSRVTAALRRAGISRDEIEAYQREATSGDYDHLLVTTMAWVSCEDEDNWLEEEG